MLIYIKLLSLFSLIEASLFLNDTKELKELKNGYHFQFLSNNGTLVVDDYFDELTKRGRVTFTRKNSAVHYYYDLSSNEMFFIDEEYVCFSMKLTPIAKDNITQLWNSGRPIGIPEGALGPVAFLSSNESSLARDEFNADWSSVKLVFKPESIIPYGFGCERPLKDGQVVPKLAVESTSFLLRMEANLYPNSIDSVIMMKHDGIFSYDVSGDSPLRIIHVPSLLTDYIIDRSTGRCYFRESISVYGSYLRWPHDEKELNNNLLSPLLLKFERQGLNYFGVKQSESISYEIYEKKLIDFWFTDNAIGPTILTYFIPTDGVNKRPMKIKMFQNDTKGPHEYWITYQESIDGFTGDPSRFDLRNCFNTEPTWFQIVFPIVPRAIFSIKSSEYLLETELRKKLDFIPINRLPVIKVGHYGPSIYVTVGLLEGADVRFNYINKTLNLEPSAVTIEDNDKDCSFLCSNNPDCDAFSYCFSRHCYLFTGVSYKKLINDENCSLFVSRTLNIESDKKKDKLNQIASSSKLLHRINLMIQQQELDLEIDRVRISAQHLFIISHPDEVGGYGEMYKDVVGQKMQLNEYKTIMENYELVGTNQLFDLTYIDCLTYCQNDGDCSTISYCTTGRGECMISSLSVYEIVANTSIYTEFNSRCFISAKSYTGNFNLLTGRSSRKPVLREIKDKSPEDCAKACINEKSFNCDAFDYCSPNVNNAHCFLYTFHSDANVSAEHSSQIWNNDEEFCNHYARKLSKEYTQFIGRKFSDHGSVIATIEQNSLENCASSCNAVQENCFSFEYCQFTDESRSPKILRTCLLSSDQLLLQEENIVKTTDFCSVYSILRNNKTVQKSLPLDKIEERKVEYHPHMYLTFFVALIATISGTIISAFLTSVFLAKKQS